MLSLGGYDIDHTEDVFVSQRGSQDLPDESGNIVFVDESLTECDDYDDSVNDSHTAFFASEDDDQEEEEEEEEGDVFGDESIGMNVKFMMHTLFSLHPKMKVKRKTTRNLCRV